RLMDPERNRIAHGRTMVRGVEALVIEPVAGLMQDSEERVDEPVRTEAGGNPAVAGPDPRAERMGRGVEPPTFEIEADRRSHGLAEYPLAVDREIALEDRLIGAAIASRDRLDERH